MDPIAVRNALLELAKGVLEGSPEVCKLAMIHRAKFEGWLKFALAGRVQATPDSPFSLADLEYHCSGSGTHVDLKLEADGSSCWVELKTCTVSWKCSDCENPYGVPITDNINGIISDCRALEDTLGGDGAFGFVLFALYPVPTAKLDEYEAWLETQSGSEADATVRYHVGRIIRDACDGTLLAHTVVAGNLIEDMPSSRMLVFCLPIVV